MAEVAAAFLVKHWGGGRDGFSPRQAALMVVIASPPTPCADLFGLYRCISQNDGCPPAPPPPCPAGCQPATKPPS